MAKRGYFNSLRGKITNRALILGIVPIALMGLLSYNSLSGLIEEVDEGLDNSRSEMLDQVVGANLSATSRRIVQQLDGFMLERIADVVTWASAPNVVEAARNAAGFHRSRDFPTMSIDEVEALFEDQKSLGLFTATDRYLSGQIESSLHFGEVFITDENGYNVALTNPTSDFVQSDEDWWVDAMDRGIAVGQVEFDSSAGIWSIDISVRIDDNQTNRRLGVMKAVLGVSLIQEVSDVRAKEIASGAVTVATEDGLLLAETATSHDTDRIMTPAGNLSGSSNDSVQNALSGGDSGFNIGDTEVLGYARSAGVELYGEVVEGFDGFNWIVLVQQPTEIALAPIENLNEVQQKLAESRKNTLLVVGIATALIALVAFIIATTLSSSIINPLSELQQAAERVARGDTSQSVSINSNDEIEDLAKIFDRMRNSVAILISRYKKMQESRR